MKGDFTRNTFEPEKHYQQVLMQQGRVQLDADWNEQAAIAEHRVETTVADLIGHCGGQSQICLDLPLFGMFIDPAQLRDKDRKRLTALFGSLPPERQPVDLSTFALKHKGDFFLSPGRYYVDGIQCENEFAIPYTAQPDRLDIPSLDANKRYLVYLDVWERHLTTVEDTSLLEPALGGVDTATRVKTVWQVHTIEVDGIPDTGACGTSFIQFDKATAPSTMQLSARTEVTKKIDNPCQVPETAGYQGLENQLYRVEIHEVDSNGKAKNWKWSRENGSIVSRLLKIDKGKKQLTVESLVPHGISSFAKGQFIEILDDKLELEGTPGELIEIADVDLDNLTITLTTDPTLAHFTKGVVPSWHPKVRRWDGQATMKSGWLPMEAGIQVRFDNPNASCRTGDYWQIPARAATATAAAGDIEWPRDPNTQGKPNNTMPLSVLPRGVQHHFCRVGLVNLDPQTGGDEFIDCRCLWPALTAPRLEYIGGDGQDGEAGHPCPTPYRAR